MQDQISENSLFLLPPSFAVVKSKSMPLLTACLQTLHDVIPTTALQIAADLRHYLADLPGELHVFILRPEAVHPHEIPRDLEIVPDDPAILLPHVSDVVRPVF